MKRLSQILQQIGGPNALSSWSFWITLPLALVVGNFNILANSFEYDLWLWNGLILLIHLALGGLVLLARQTFLGKGERPAKPHFALFFFASLGIVRTFALEVLDPLFGPNLATLESRLLTNVVGGTLLLALIAIVVDDYRSHSQLAIELQRAEASLKWLNDREASTLMSADLDEIAQVRAEVERELMSGEAGAENIRRISELVVRARSHTLSETAELKIEYPPPVSRSKILGLQSILNTLHWPDPVALAMLLQLIVLGAVASLWGLTIAIANFFLAGLVIATGAWLLGRYVKLPSSPILRPVLLALALSILAVITSSASSAAITRMVGPFPPNYATAVVLVLLIGLGVSTWDSVTRERQNQRQLLMGRVSQEAELMERLHGEVSRRRSAAADFLHGPIQSQLVASALRGETNEEALEAIERRFDEYLAEDILTDTKTQAAELIEAWADLVTIKLAASEQVWQNLELQPVKSRLLLDILSEAITNTVRHGHLDTIEISIGLGGIDSSSRFRVTIESFGKLTGGIGAGSGLSRLIDRGAQVSIKQLGQKIILSATV